MADSSDFTPCSPVIEIPTTEDLLHPESHITPEEMLKYRTMHGCSPKPSKGSTQHEENSEYSELDNIKNEDFKCAEASLAHYNNLHSTNYKLIEVTKCNGFFHGWVWYHCLFKAALETSTVPEIFFSELHSLGYNNYHVVTIARVENVTETYDCLFCFGKNILHPVLTLSRYPDLLFWEGRKVYRGEVRESQDISSIGVKGFEASKEYLNKASDLEPFLLTYGIKHEGHGKMHNDFVSGHREVSMIDGVNTQICEDAQQTIATDAAPSHSPILPLVDVAPTAIKGDASGTGSGADNVQNKENIQARSSVKRKALEGVSPPR